MTQQSQTAPIAKPECDLPADQSVPELSTTSSRPSRENLLNRWDAEQDMENEAVPLVRIDGNEVLLIPFTPDSNWVQLHYCEEQEIEGYVKCNGEDCVLCRVGKKKEERALLPVYMPASRRVGVLSISPSSRPGALRPQIMPILRSGSRVALLVRRLDRAAFVVSTAELADDVDDGTEFIDRFQRRWDAGEIDLTTAYQQIDNRDLAEISGIATLMQFKRIAL